MIVRPPDQVRMVARDELVLPMNERANEKATARCE